MRVAILVIAWLALCTDLSLRVANTLLKALQILNYTADRFGTLSSTQDSPDLQLKLPQDIRTVFKTLDLDPTLSRYMLCPKCFQRYDLETCPQRSTSCGEPLWRIKYGALSGPILVPKRLYTTQSFENWLSHFVSLPVIEQQLDRSNLTATPRYIMRDVVDSPAWQTFGDYGSQPGNLIFGLFVDWYNPYLTILPELSIRRLGLFDVL